MFLKASDRRATRSVYRTLLFVMLAFGLLVGLLFPPFAKIVLDSERALSIDFFLMCVLAGFRAAFAGDVFCRYGGEEFMVAAPGTGLADAAELGERLRRLVETTRVPWSTLHLSVSMSVGVATWPMAQVSVSEELITIADRALYVAKERGRNQIAAYQRDRVVGLAEVAPRTTDNLT